MKTLKRLVSFTAIFNLTFITILILQYRYRFNHTSDFNELIMYASIPSIIISIIPLVCFFFCRLIFLRLIQSKIHHSAFLHSALVILTTATMTYFLTEIVFHDFVASLLCVVSTVVTLILLFYMDSRSNKKVLTGEQ